MKRKNFFNYGAILCLASFFMACSGDDDPALVTSGSRTIVEIASETENLSTFVSALRTAELVDTFDGTGPFTILAPTNAAFESLPARVLEDLLGNKEELKKVLNYHVLSGRVDAGEASSLDSAATLQGANVSIRTQGASVLINEAHAVITDIQASNGMIHIIDEVLIPPTLTSIVAVRRHFSILMRALRVAGLKDLFRRSGPFTLFAPTDAAFNRLPPGVLDKLLANRAALRNVLKYHVVKGRVRSKAARRLRAADTLQGTSIIFSTAGTRLKVNQATVKIANIFARNGVIHVIDAVLQPSTVVGLAGFNPDLATLVTAVGAAKLGDALSGTGPFTVFAPTDAAFAALPPGTLTGLLANIPALTKVLTYHVLGSRALSSDIARLTTATTLQGQAVKITARPGSIQVNQATVVAPDIKGTNGVLHVIDGVLIPPR